MPTVYAPIVSLNKFIFAAKFSVANLMFYSVALSIAPLIGNNLV